MNRPIKRALISVSDKTGIIEFAHALHTRGVEILSTGGTAALLAKHDIPICEVSDYTGFPEIMDGRVKTLHPRIHGGLLGRPGTDDTVMEEHNILGIDLLVVNLYPFTSTIATPDCTLETAIENIDIGGPAMLRAAAKNHAAVAVVIDQSDYAPLITEIDQNQQMLSQHTRFQLACKAFAHTAEYDTAIADYLGKVHTGATESAFADPFHLKLQKQCDLRYGENPHQRAAFYIEQGEIEPSISTATQYQGKALSYNNIADCDTALECVKQFERPSCVIVKHANPCGVATADTLSEAYQSAFLADSTSAFGGIIAFNKTLDGATATAIIKNQFVEAIIAPDIDQEALSVMSAKPNVRVLGTGFWGSPRAGLDYKRVNGGLLVQDRDIKMITADNLTLASERKPAESEIEDLLFAWKVCKFVKSNAVVYANKQCSVGIGAGQMSRIDSAKIAASKISPSNNGENCVMASDAFFPFRDAIDAAHQANIRAIIQPGGSIRDDEVIAAANEYKIAMVFTGIRHFRH